MERADLIACNGQMKDVSLSEMKMDGLEEPKAIEQGFPLSAMDYADLIRESWWLKSIEATRCT